MRRVLRIVIYSLLGGMVLLLAVMGLLYLHTPGWYRPVTLSQEELEQATGELNALVLGTNNELNRNPPGQAVTRTVTQDELNRYLQAMPLYDPRAKQPDWLAEPMIVLQQDRLILAGRVAQLRNRTVSLHLRPRVEAGRLAIDVEHVAIGSLPLPRQAVRDQLGELGQALDDAARKSASKSAGKSRTSVKDALLDMGVRFFRAVQGEPMPPEFATPDIRRPFRLERLDIQPGKLTLTLLPEGEPVAAPPAPPDLPPPPDEPPFQEPPP